MYIRNANAFQYVFMGLINKSNFEVWAIKKQILGTTFLQTFIIGKQ